MISYDIITMQIDTAIVLYWEYNEYYQYINQNILPVEREYF